ncbi:hypothetical protein JW948_09105 [bacterium]|nr:hypothetical protein [bacterium]
MAEGILRKMIADHGITHIRIRSAGMLAVNGAPAASSARSVSGNHGVDLSAHAARFVSADLIDEADVILVMERNHLQEIREWFPGGTGKIFLLKSFGPDGTDEEVDDPIGGNPDLFELCFQVIESEIRRIFPALLAFCGRACPDDKKTAN